MGISFNRAFNNKLIVYQSCNRAGTFIRIVFFHDIHELAASN